MLQQTTHCKEYFSKIHKRTQVKQKRDTARLHTRHGVGAIFLEVSRKVSTPWRWICAIAMIIVGNLWYYTNTFSASAFVSPEEGRRDCIHNIAGACGTWREIVTRRGTPAEPGHVAGSCAEKRGDHGGRHITKRTMRKRAQKKKKDGTLGRKYPCDPQMLNPYRRRIAVTGGPSGVHQKWNVSFFDQKVVCCGIFNCFVDRSSSTHRLGRWRALTSMFLTSWSWVTTMSWVVGHG